MFDRILVPLDGSPVAEAALPYALALAKKSEGSILLACVTETSHGDEPATKYLSQMETRIAGRLGGSQRVETRVLPGDASRSVLALAAKDTDIVVITSHGKNRTAEWPLGSTASRVLQRARVPVLLVPLHPGEVNEQVSFGRILLPLDASAPGEAAAGTAGLFARLFSAAVVLLHVEPQPRPWLLGPGVEYAYLPAVSGERQARKLAEHTAYLEGVAATLQAQGVATSIEVGSGSPAAEILGYARKNKIDLIAISTHGSSGIDEFVYGGVAEKMLHSSEIPLLVVRPVKGAA